MKTRSFLLASIVILATLFFTGVVFAEGEVPQAPAAEVPPEIPAETPIAVEEAVIVEASTQLADGEPAPKEPAVTAPMQTVEGDIPAEPVPASTDVQPEAPVIEAVPVEEVLPVVEAPVVIGSAPEALIPEQATVEEPALTTVEPEIVLVGHAGEELDMASQASADVIASADPYYTVGLITYHFSNANDFCASGDPYCFDGDTLSETVTGNAIQFAIDHISIFGVPTDGKIYIENATYV